MAIAEAENAQRPANGDTVIGLDCSTTSVKGIALDRKGNVIARANRSISLRSPHPNYYEQDPEEWWRASCAVLKKITDSVRAEKIAALSVSNQRETFVALSSDGAPVRPAIVWLDERCKDEVEPFARKVGRERIHRITGKPVDYAPVIYRLAWMKRHEPDLFKRIGMVCDVHAYLVWKLTGEFKTSWASADPLGIFDLKKKTWSPEILKAIGLTTKQLPSAFAPGIIVGKASESAAVLTGLQPGTAIAAGGGDGQAAGLGSNALSSRRAYLNLGTAAVAGIYGPKYKTSKAFRTMGSCSEGGYYYECSLRAGTFAIDWLIRKILGIDPEKLPGIYKELETEARGVSPGCDGLFHLPYLCGVMNPYWDESARGAFVGLSSSHTRGHVFRSILEGIAFEQRFAVGKVERVIKTEVREFAAIGGGAESELWLSIIADVTGKKVVVPETTEASALGAGIAAAVSAGWYSSFSEAASRMSGPTREVLPDRTRRRAYSALFEKYKKLYPGLNRLESGSR